MTVSMPAYAPKGGLCLVAALGVLCNIAVAYASSGDKVVLLTIEPGKTAPTRFGHAALCIVSAARPEGECYNYGAANTAKYYMWHMILVDAPFLIRKESFPHVVGHYKGQGRAVWAQVLGIPPPRVGALRRRLEDDSRPGFNRYEYRPFTRNCTTHLRDLIDAAVDGRLFAATQEASSRTDRESANTAARGSLVAKVGASLLLGTDGDRRLSGWESMFQPSVLKEMVERHLESPPIEVSSKLVISDSTAEAHQVTRVALSIVGMLVVILFWAAHKKVWLTLLLLYFLSLVLAGIGLLIWVLIGTCSAPGLNSSVFDGTSVA